MAAPTGPAARISISDPQKQGEGMSAFISYKVHTEFLRPVDKLPAGSTVFNVIRRFSDFVWLREAMHEAFPYLLVPALPEKQALGRLNADFVDVRHRALQRWIDRVCHHPELGACDAVVKFTTLSDASFAALRDASRSASAVVSSAAVAAGTGMLKAIRAAGTAISNAVADARAPAGGDGAAPGAPGAAPGSTVSSSAGKSAEDLSFGELETYLLHQAPLITALYNAAAESAVKYREDAQQLLDFGASLRALGTSEGGGLGSSLTAVNLSTWAASTAAYEQAVQESEMWVERLADHVRSSRAVREMIAERQSASAALADALSVVERLRAHITALQASPSASAAADKAKAETELTTAQTVVAEARVYYDKVAAAVIGEVERHRSHLRVDFRSMLLDYAVIQQRTAAKLAAAWEKAVPECTGAIATEGATPLPTGAGVAAAVAGLVSSAPAASAPAASNDFAAYTAPAVPGSGSGDPTAPGAAANPYATGSGYDAMFA